MSLIVNDYIMSSNNSINENLYNTEKLRSSKIHKLKNLIKPVLSILRGTSRRNTYKKSISPSPPSDCLSCCSSSFDSAYESEQNNQNEDLERRIIAEIDECLDGFGVPVYSTYSSNIPFGCPIEEMKILPIVRGEHYIPVHFAKTESGTFFWTTVSVADNEKCFDECHIGDRWAQA